MKKFYRSRTSRKLSGISGGLGEYFDTDPLLWRLLFTVLFFTATPMVLLYILTTFITESK